MNTLVIHDETGYVIFQGSGNAREPVGIPFLWVEVPQGKRVKDGIGVDTSVTPHKVILEDIPPTEVDSLKKQIADLEYTLMMNGVI